MISGYGPSGPDPGAGGKAALTSSGTPSKAFVVEQGLDDPPGLVDHLLVGEALVVAAQGVPEQALVRGRLLAELLGEEQIEVDLAQRFDPGLLRLDDQAGAGVGVDAEDQLVGVGRDAAADPQRRRAAEDHPD